MPLFLKRNGDFTPAPEGLHLAVCVDVVDRGIRETAFGSKPQVMLVWEIAAHTADNRPFTVRKIYTASMHEKSNLHKDLKAWRGRPFTAEELAAFDVENVIGTSCQLLLQHTEKDGSVWANVAAVTKTTPGQKLTPSGHYTRVGDRPQQEIYRTMNPENQHGEIPF
jgi:hypothetical protein